MASYILHKPSNFDNLHWSVSEYLPGTCSPIMFISVKLRRVTSATVVLQMGPDTQLKPCSVPCLQIGEALEAEVTVAKVKGRYISFDTICRRYQDKAVIVDGVAMACL